MDISCTCLGLCKSHLDLKAEGETDASHSWNQKLEEERDTVASLHVLFYEVVETLETPDVSCCLKSIDVVV